MKLSALLSIAASLFASSTYAGSLDQPAPSAPIIAPIAANSTDWGGFYLGVQASTEAGVFDTISNGVPVNSPSDLEGSMAGGFAGYNIQRGKIVFGGEVNYSVGSAAIVNSPAFEYRNFVDVNARLGFSAGRALVYATVGGSFGDWYSSPAGPFSGSGFNYGVGLDYKVTDRIFVGASYMIRDMSGSFAPIAPTLEFLTDTQSLRIRAGIQF